MSERTHSGYPAGHADAVFATYKRVLCDVAAVSPVNDAVIAKRLRIIGSALIDMAAHIDGRDPEALALDTIDAEFAAFLAGRKAERS